MYFVGSLLMLNPMRFQNSEFMKTTNMIGLMDLHRWKLTYMFPQFEPKIDALYCCVCPRAFPVHIKRLGRPVLSSINGKCDDKHSEPNMTCIYPSWKTETEMRKDSNRKKMNKNQVTQKWETDLTNPKRKNWWRHREKREERQGCIPRLQHCLQLGIAHPCEVIRTVD